MNTVPAAHHSCDVLVLGAGAAGLFCAAEAGRRGLKVALLDHADAPGKKILISGGGRCNFTNLHTRAENFLSENPHFARSALARYSPQEFLAEVERHGIGWHEKELGQLFCNGSARQIVTMLERECADAKVTLALGRRVLSVQRGETFVVRAVAQGAEQSWSARAVVIATGGLSIPKLGATGFGYDVARQFGLRVVEPRPALVPMTLSGADLDMAESLAGVSVDANVQAGRTRFTHKLLFTHRGFSGPAVLQASSYWRVGEPLRIDLLPGREAASILRAKPSGRTSAALAEALRGALPSRLVEQWMATRPPTGWSDRDLAAFDAGLHNWQMVPSGTEGFAKAEVTAGGVDTAELDAKTMQSRRVPGLYFIGEVVDVTGWLGGFNFQWAWASAAAAGRSVLT